MSKILASKILALIVATLLLVPLVACTAPEDVISTVIDDAPWSEHCYGYRHTVWQNDTVFCADIYDYAGWGEINFYSGSDDLHIAKLYIGRGSVTIASENNTGVIYRLREE